MIYTKVIGAKSTQKKNINVSSSVKSRFKFKPVINPTTTSPSPVRHILRSDNFRNTRYSNSTSMRSNGRYNRYNQNYNNQNYRNNDSRFYHRNGGYRHSRWRYQSNYNSQVTSETPLVKKAAKPMLFVLLKRTNNNIFMSLSYKNGVPLYQTSGGATGIPGSKRDTPASAETAAKLLAKQIVNRGYFRCFLRIDGVFDNTVRSAVRGLRSAGFVRFLKLQHLKTVAHNGVRKSKPRRT